MTLAASAIPGATLFRHGKVREVYEAGPGRLVMVASDRLSAFDVVLPTPIPDKGRVLTQLSNFWFGRTASSSRTTCSRPTSLASRRRSRNTASSMAARCS